MTLAVCVWGGARTCALQPLFVQYACTSNTRTAHVPRAHTSPSCAAAASATARAQHLERWFQEQGAIKSSGRVRRDRGSAMSLMGSNSGGGNSGNSSNSDSGGRLLREKAAWSADSSDDTTRSVVTSVAGGATHSALSSPAGNENANGYVKDSLIESPNLLDRIHSMIFT
jgi:hypothetical protein